jgi:hypothetical protein
LSQVLEEEMRGTLSAKRKCSISFFFVILAACAQAQNGGSGEIRTKDGTQEFIPSKNVEFKAVASDPNFTLPAIQEEYPHCLSDGSLVLHTIDWEALKKLPKGAFPKYNRIVTIAHGKTTLTILSTRINDLTDFQIADVFPADSGIYFLLQGTKEQPGEHGPGKSPSGIPLKDYRYYIARFDLDGSYKGATKLDRNCDLSRPGRCEMRHIAVFPSGDMLATEPDPDTSTLRVLYLKSSGEMVKQIDVPASRRLLDWGDAHSGPNLEQDAKMYISSVYFTPVGNNIVVWRSNSDDPVVEVTQGGGVREVPVQIPDGWRLVDMVSANDRWVVHFRTENTAPTVRMSTDTDEYFEVHPQDGTLAAKIVQKGDVPLSIACESSGTYTSFKWGDTGKMVLLQGQ